jgi:hypothetical protein
MASVCIGNVGIGLTSSLLAGAVSLIAATGVGAAAARPGNPGGSYVKELIAADGGDIGAESARTGSLFGSILRFAARN